MLQFKADRFKTANLDRLVHDGYRNLGKCRRLDVHSRQQDRIRNQIYKATSKDAPRSRYGVSDSGRVNFQVLKPNLLSLSSFESIKSEVRLLSPTQKLLLIQQILRNTRQLSKKFEYFIVTLPLLKFEFDLQIKVSVQIHPDLKSTIPLEPIQKQTEFQCELECVSSLKQLIKTIFPSIYLGDGRTFTTIISHLDMLKANLTDFSRKNDFNDVEDALKNPESKLISRKTELLKINSNTIPLLLNDGQQDQRNRIIFETYKKNTNTASTLVSTIRSENGLSFYLKKMLQAEKSEEDDDFQQREVIKKPQVVTSRTKFVQQKSPKQSLFDELELVLNEEPVSKKLKDSNIGRKMMSMSTQIESQINNLFGDSRRSNILYINDSELRQSVKFELSKVNEQFDDLF